MSERSRRYDSPVRRQRVAETRERIVAAGSALVHGYASWDWRELTFRAVAERAGVSERTVYRHFPTERHLHDAVMQRLEAEAGISYEAVEPANLAEITAAIFASLGSFAARPAVHEPDAPTFVAVDQRRRDALVRAVTETAPEWALPERAAAAALLDVLWNLPTYERLVGVWGIDGADATRAITWLQALLLRAIRDGDRPPVARPARG